MQLFRIFLGKHGPRTARRAGVPRAQCKAMSYHIVHPLTFRHTHTHTHTLLRADTSTHPHSHARPLHTTRCHIGIGSLFWEQKCDEWIGAAQYPTRLAPASTAFYAKLKASREDPEYVGRDGERDGRETERETGREMGREMDLLSPPIPLCICEPSFADTARLRGRVHGLCLSSPLFFLSSSSRVFPQVLRSSQSETMDRLFRY
jgi:hypothetical protein